MIGTDRQTPLPGEMQGIEPDWVRHDLANRVSLHLFRDDGTFPNSDLSGLPLLLYRNAVLLPDKAPERVFEHLFELNGWGRNVWRSDIYDFHHYHTTAHEVLGCYAGHATIRFGGDETGENVQLHAGDVVVIPAGVAHRSVGHSQGFGVVGGYPATNGDVDMNYGKDMERPAADHRIKTTTRPRTDPLCGAKGPLTRFWL